MNVLVFSVYLVEATICFHDHYYKVDFPPFSIMMANYSAQLDHEQCAQSAALFHLVSECIHHLVYITVSNH